MEETIIIQEISDNITIVIVEQQLDTVQEIVMQNVVEKTYQEPASESEFASDLVLLYNISKL